MSPLQAILIAIIQGVTELFPVSSLGHAVVLPALLHWNVNQQSDAFLPFLVVLHFGTGSALMAYFWRDWWALLRGFAGAGDAAFVTETRKLIVLMVVATLPAVVLGLAFEKIFKHLFGVPQIAAFFLIVNGVVLFAGERLRNRQVQIPLEQMNWRGALAIGFWQSTALIPGISRSGATMLGGVLLGLRHDAAARFSFLIATPVIFAAGVLEIPKLFHPHAASLGPMVWIAGAIAGVFAYLSTWFLMHYFKRHDFDALDPFAYYCVGFGLLSLLFLMA